MLEILVLWIIVFLITWLAGDLLFFAFDRGLKHELDKKGATVKSIAGFFVLTVIAQYVSLFSPLNTNALKGIATVLMLLEVLRLKKHKWKGRRKEDKKTLRFIVTALKLLWLILILICCVNYDFNELHGDSDLYMAQSVKWAGEYGAVKGIANFNPRIGFDSSLVCFYALSSLRAMAGGRIHAACGFLFVIFGWYGIEAVYGIMKEGFLVSKLFRLVMPGYAATTMHLSGAYTTDTVSNLAAGFFVAEWAAAAEAKEEGEEVYGLLAVAAVICASMKLSLAMLVLAALLPGIRMLKKKKFKTVLLFLGMGVACIVPYVLRTVILTGYLIFPMEKIDLFDFAWKVPSDMVCLEREMVELWAKAPGTELENIRGGISGWINIWLENQRGSYGYMLVLANIAALAGIVVMRLLMRKKEDKAPYMMILITALIAEGLYWFIEAPDYRFIQLLMFFLPVYLAFCIYKLLPKHFVTMELIAVILFIAVFFSYHPKWIMNDNISFITRTAKSGELTQLAFEQPRLKEYEMKSIDWNGISVQVPKSGMLSGYATLPCTMYADYLDRLYLLGADISDGVGVK